jgi:hypothetical protein
MVKKPSFFRLDGVFANDRVLREDSRQPTPPRIVRNALLDGAPATLKPRNVFPF